MNDDSGYDSTSEDASSISSDSSNDDMHGYKLARLLVLASTALSTLCDAYAASLAADTEAAANAINAIALMQSNSRRDYSQPRRVFSPG